MKKLLHLLFLLPSLVLGQQIEVPLLKPCPYGYLEYIPLCETVTENCNIVYRCPKALLIALNGFGIRGNGITDLSKVANEGVARLIKDGQWNRTEFIVISPQLFTGQNMYSPKTLHVFITQMLEKYPVDTTEVYLVGISGGANSIYPYISTYKGIRGAVAISGYGSSKLAIGAFTNGTKVWEFHGQNDGIVPYSTSFYKAYSAAEVIDTDNSKFTGWPGVGHSGWHEVISGKWLEKTAIGDPFNENIFDWLLR